VLGERTAVDGGGARRGGVEAEDHPHRGRLAGAVRAEEAGDDAGADGEAEVVDGELLAVGLGEVGDFDHVSILQIRRRPANPPPGGFSLTPGGVGEHRVQVGFRNGSRCS
jgi:hypothetical protein